MKNETESKIKRNEETIDELLKKRKIDKNIKLILIIIIIILIILLCLLISRLGKIGVEETSSSDTVEIIVSDEDVLINKNTQLDIFNNIKFDNEKMVAPGSYGDYTFYITNEGSDDLTYDITFSDTMSNPVNMMYKLKINNVYIVGSSTEYVSISNLDIDDIIIMPESTDRFTLEWCWIDNDEEDTITGELSTEESREYYTLNLGVYIKSY